MTCVVVFDTNILFSGFGWRGNPFHCLQLARRGKVVSVTCQEILAELEEALRLKRNMAAADTARAVTEVLSFSRLVTIPNTLEVIAADPDDDEVLECALVGGATHIVTDDRRHLLPLGRYQRLPSSPPPSSSKSDLRRLLGKGLIRKIGSARSTRYKIG